MVAASPPPSVKKNPKPKTHDIQSALSRITLRPASREPAHQDCVQPAQSYPVQIMSSQLRASPYSQPRASPSRLRPASWEPACADRIQLAKNHLRVSMSGLSRSSSAGQKSARLNHIQLTESQLIQIISSRPRASLSWPCPASRELARPNRIRRAESQPIAIVSSLQIGSLCRARPPISIGSRYSRASLSRSRPTTRGPARPDRIHPTRLDRFQQVESQPTQIASSQLGLLTNCSCESHTQAKRYGSLIMTEKDHLPTNEHSVICHSKMVGTTINQWECFEQTNQVYNY